MHTQSLNDPVRFNLPTFAIAILKNEKCSPKLSTIVFLTRPMPTQYPPDKLGEILSGIPGRLSTNTSVDPAFGPFRLYLNARVKDVKSVEIVVHTYNIHPRQLLVCNEKSVCCLCEIRAQTKVLFISQAEILINTHTHTRTCAKQ